MNDRDGMDRLLRTWFAEGAARTAPAHIAATVAEVTRGRRQQPRWLAWLTGIGTWVGGSSSGRTHGHVLAFALVTGTMLTVMAGALLSVGGSPAPPPFSRIYTSVTPWSFDQPADVCLAGSVEPLPPGPLPDVGPPAIAHPHNGMVAVGSSTLIDPTTGAVTATHLPGVSSIYGNAWSPDGRWLAIGWGGDPASGAPPSCRDIYLLSSDGTHLANVTGYPSDDQAIDVAWSPDGQWLAISRWVAVGADGGVAIDALRIGPAASVIDGRRLWASDASGIESLGWSRDGNLAWTYIPKDLSDLGMLVLRPGELQPSAIDLGGIGLTDPRWSADDHELVAVGEDASGAVRSIYVVIPSDGSVRALDLAVPPLGGKYTWDAELFTSSDGKVFYPGRTDGTGHVDIYAAGLDGRDDRNLTSIPLAELENVSFDHVISFDAVLSPDEARVAFLMDGSAVETPGVWTVDVDGTGPARLLHATDPYGGLIAWQPVQ